MYAVSSKNIKNPKKMNKNSTLSVKCVLSTIITILFFSFTQAQTAPKLKFENTGLASATDGQRNATYKLSDFTAAADSTQVTYPTFDVTLTNNKVNLFWITDAETGNDHFEVERSFDQTDFSTVAIILGAESGNANSSQYSFRDGTQELLNHTIIYYRLKKVGADEKFTYSVVKMVQINTNVTKVFAQVSPNPRLDRLNVNL